MNHKERAKAAINRYERARGEYDAKAEQFHEHQAQTQSDISDLDKAITGSLQNIEQARRNIEYGALVKDTVDDMPERGLISKYYSFGYVGNSNIGSHFGSVDNGSDRGAAYAAGAGAAGIGIGAGAAAGAYGLAGAIGVASTGTAIGGLSGAAATSASLAWLGGGALAVGGLGMAGGLVALTGIGLVPLAAAGVVGGILYKKKNKQRADAIEQEVKEKIDAMNLAHEGMALGGSAMSRLGNVARQHTAHIRVLNNRHLGPAIQAGDSAFIANNAKLLIVAIHEAITEMQDLWNELADRDDSPAQRA